MRKSSGAPAKALVFPSKSGWSTRWLRFLRDYVLAGAGALYMFTAGLFQARHRIFLQGVVRHLGWREDPAQMPPPVKLPSVSLNSVLNPAREICLIEAEERYGNVSTLELAVINSLVRGRRPEAIFEIGTFDGRTTLNLAANAPPNARVLTLDLPAELADGTAFELDENDRVYIQKPEPGARFKGNPLSQRIVQLRGDSATFDYTQFLGQMELVFVDGSHSYAYVLNDSHMAMRLLGQRGIIIWHDYGCDCEGVTRALNELFGSRAEFKNLKHIRGTRLAYLETDIGAASADV